MECFSEVIVVMWSSFFNTEKSREEQRKAEI